VPAMYFDAMLYLAKGEFNDSYFASPARSPM
jgi:hypothetical protein